MEELLAMIYANYNDSIIQLLNIKLSEYSCSEEEDQYFKEEAKENLDYMAELLNKVRDEYNKR